MHWTHACAMNSEQWKNACLHVHREMVSNVQKRICIYIVHVGFFFSFVLQCIEYGQRTRMNRNKSLISKVSWDAHIIVSLMHNSYWIQNAPCSFKRVCSCSMQHVSHYVDDDAIRMVMRLTMLPLPTYYVSQFILVQRTRFR